MDFERLSDDNFQNLITHTYNQSNRRSDTSREDLIYEMYIYIPRPKSQESVQRATRDRILAATAQVQQTIRGWIVL